jgi:hypothetical protein
MKHEHFEELQRRYAEKSREITKLVNENAAVLKEMEEVRAKLTGVPAPFVQE